MAELALLGYNVAIPEIDTGDDVFVLNDQTGQLSRIQLRLRLALSSVVQRRIVVSFALMNVMFIISRM
jgi:hypothetical protein